MVDRFFYKYVINVHGEPPADVPTSGTGFRGLEWQPLANGRLLVVAYEHPDHPGRSVTNASEDIARQFAGVAGVDVSRLVWVESYAAERPASVPGQVMGFGAADPPWAARLQTATLSRGR